MIHEPRAMSNEHIQNFVYEIDRIISETISLCESNERNSSKYERKWFSLMPILLISHQLMCYF